MPKTELRATVGLKFDKKMTGKQLQDCGIFKDSDGYLIPTTSNYGVMLTVVLIPKKKK